MREKFENSANETVSEKRIMKVYKGQIARMLLRKGYEIIDVKPNPARPIQTIFIFKRENGIEKVVEKIAEDIRNNKN